MKMSKSESKEPYDVLMWILRRHKRPISPNDMFFTHQEAIPEHEFDSVIYDIMQYFQPIKQKKKR